MIKFCKVKQCRFSNSHTTRNHLCGNCNILGHGILECNSIILKNELKQYYNEKMNESDYCKFSGCEDKEYHNLFGHHCKKCNRRMHSPETCNLKNIKEKNYEIKCLICKKDNKINSKQSKIYGYEEQCIVCMDKNIEIFFPDCGHMCLCKICFDKMKKIENNNDNFPILYSTEFKLKDYPSYTIQYQGMGCYSIVKRLNKDSNIETLFIHSDDHMVENVDEKINKFVLGYCKIE